MRSASAAKSAIQSPALPGSLLSFLTGLVFLLAALSCDDDGDVRAIFPYALAGPDSLAAGETLIVQFSYDAGTGGHLESYEWAAIGDSVFALTIFYRFARSGEGCGARPARPGSFPETGLATLREVPARPFTILTRDVGLRIQGGAVPSRENRLTVHFVDARGEGIAGAGGHIENSAGTGDSIAFPATDAEGVVVLRAPCTDSDREYLVDFNSSDRGGQGRAFWPADCLTPQQMVVLGR